MEIVKSLDINKRYNRVPNGSIVMAKNMRVNEDVSALELDEGFKDILAEAIEKYNEDNNTTLTFDPIVGIIECPKEVVLFTYSHLPSPNGTSNIYRLKEIGDNEVELVKCNTAWQYNGGYRNSTYVNSHINGTYTYNVKGELIVTIGEYTNDNKDVPLRVINLDLDTHTNQLDDYNVAPNVPIANLKLINTISGPAIPTGTYYFFIRYKIYENEYTNWFPIGIPYQALNIENKLLFNHDYKTTDSTHWSKHPLNYLSVPVNNTNKDCNFNFVFKLTTSSTNFTEAQIGYILQHGSSTVARYYKDINISSEDTFIFNGKFKEEADINNFIENPLPLYNVHCIANFENRNYIANYKEENDKYDASLAALANNISVQGVQGNSIARWASTKLDNPNDFLSLNSIYTIRDARLVNEEEEDIPEEGQMINFNIAAASAPGSAILVSSNACNSSYNDPEQQAAITELGRPIGQSDNVWYWLTPKTSNTIVSSYGIKQNILLISNYQMDSDMLHGWTSYHDTYSVEVPVICLILPPYKESEKIYIDITLYDTNTSSLYIAYDAGYTFHPLINCSASLVGNRLTVNTQANKHACIPLILFGTNDNTGPRPSYIKNIHITSDSLVKLKSDSSSSNNTTNSIVLKNNLTFSYPNSLNTISLYDLLSSKGLADWLFGSEATTNLLPNDTVSIGSNGVKAIKDVYLWLGEEPYLTGIGYNVDFCFYVPGNGRNQYVYTSEFTLNTNNKQFKSIKHNWGAAVIRDMGTPSYSTSNINVIDEGTFDPEESYKFYIHYVRKNGTYTKGYPIVDTLAFQRDFGLYKWYPRFTNISVSAPFIGYFITYKQITNRRVFTGTLVSPRDTDDTSEKQEQRNWLRVRATDVEIGLNNYQGDYAVLEFDNGNAVGNSISTGLLSLDRSKTRIMIGNIYDQDDHKGTLGKPGSIRLGLNSTISGVTILDGYSSGRHVVSVFNENPNLSTSTTYDDLFELVSLGPIIYQTGTNLSFVATPTNNYDINYPSRIIKETTYYFNRRIYFSSEELTPKYYNFSTHDGVEDFILTNCPHEYLEVYEYYKYSRINLNAIEINNNPTEIIVASETSGSKDRFNKATYVEPQNSHDLFRFPSEYFINNYKLYFEVKQNDNIITHFTKSIRRSNVLADESSEVSLRNFNANQYKVISNNKGNITALVALGTDLLVHTENTLFRISKQAILEADSRSVDVTAGDLFSIDPQEVFTANHGYGGLQVENNWCTNEHGYWFYDRDNHKLFNLDNGQLNDIGEPILKYLNSIYPTDVRFNTDFKNHRVLICFKENDLTTHHPVTFSFNALTKSFISIHDFYFGVRCNTKNNVYFLGYLGYRNPATGSNLLNIYKFDGVANRAYANLSSVAANFPEFVDAGWDANQCAAYIDIIFNNQYPIIRNLDSINYLLGYKEEFDDFDYKLFEDREKYSGNYIEIYTDSTDSRILDLSQGTEVNTYNDYKHPHYNKGSWQFNYFRNIVAKELTAAQLNEYLTRLDLTESALPYIINGITDNDNPSEIDQVIRPSDERSLIYGKYIIVRFIFTDTDNKQIRFEDVSANVNSY